MDAPRDDDLDDVLAKVRSGDLDPAAAAARIRAGVLDDLGFAQIDHDRARRRGYPEAVLCEGKRSDHLVGIAESFRSLERPALFTRMTVEQRDAVVDVLPDAVWHADARCLTWSTASPPVTGGLVTVVSAGTSDHAVAAEAAVTAEFYGRPVETIRDVGIAGLHRVLRRVAELRRSRCLIVVAGMDGALPAVVSGLVEAPVIAVPTSVGYGAAFDGLAPLLTMLSSCSPGVAVVNIDNGFGAGHLAAQITRPASAP